MLHILVCLIRGGHWTNIWRYNISYYLNGKHTNIAGHNTILKSESKFLLNLCKRYNVSQCKMILKETQSKRIKLNCMFGFIHWALHTWCYVNYPLYVVMYQRLRIHMIHIMAAFGWWILILTHLLSFIFTSSSSCSCSCSQQCNFNCSDP